MLKELKNDLLQLNDSLSFVIIKVLLEKIKYFKNKLAIQFVNILLKN